uniref:Uncharacterized protein n=1 Tax=Anguilla anguilla TaxID=7936 RepID=A0A0E9V7Z3_ANGAN
MEDHAGKLYLLRVGLSLPVSFPLTEELYNRQKRFIFKSQAAVYCRL